MTDPNLDDEARDLWWSQLSNKERAGRNPALAWLNVATEAKESFRLAVILKRAKP